MRPALSKHIKTINIFNHKIQVSLKRGHHRVILLIFDHRSRYLHLHLMFSLSSNQFPQRYWLEPFNVIHQTSVELIIPYSIKVLLRSVELNKHNCTSSFNIMFFDTYEYTSSAVSLTALGSYGTWGLEGASRDPTRFARKDSILPYSLRSERPYPTLLLGGGTYGRLLLLI